jgi:hypothetical protein
MHHRKKKIEIANDTAVPIMIFPINTRAKKSNKHNDYVPIREPANNVFVKPPPVMIMTMGSQTASASVTTPLRRVENELPKTTTTSRTIKCLRTLLTEDNGVIKPFCEIVPSEPHKNQTDDLIVNTPDDQQITQSDSVDDAAEACVDQTSFKQETNDIGRSSTMSAPSDTKILTESALFPVFTPVLSVERRVVQAQTEEQSSSSNQTVPEDLLSSVIVTDSPDIRNDDKMTWPSLSMDNINTTFSVVGNLKTGVRVKIVDDRYLAVDNTYVSSFTRYTSGQCRERNLSFISHLYNETKRHTIQLLTDIRRGIDVDTRVSELEIMISNMMIFLHNFDMIRQPYESDTGTYAKFGVISRSFLTFRQCWFRDVLVAKAN